MPNKNFNPNAWIQKPDLKKQAAPIPRQKAATNIERDVEVIVRRIENYKLDLTMNYQDWLTVGFAFADEFGESGRDYFHRLSRFYPGYDFSKCGRQYDKCLKRGKRGISIKSFFAMARDAGVNIRV